MGILRFIALLLTALALTMTSAHVLELPVKMQYAAPLYSAVNTTLYRYFAIVGGVYCMGSLLALGALAWGVRENRVVFRWTLAAALLQMLWFVSWLTLVQPVNNEVAAAIHSSPETVAGLWLQLRARWEYGHAVGFFFQLLSFCCLGISLLIGRAQRGTEERADSGNPLVKPYP